MNNQEQVTQYTLIIVVICGMLTIVNSSAMSDTIRYSVGMVGVGALLVAVYRLSKLMSGKGTK